MKSEQEKMQMKFYKYQAVGNDFVMVDNRYLKNVYTTEQIKKLCDRRFGIGADGFILLNTKEGFDFEMVYFNADGKEGSMCGNGGRSIVKFANHCGIIKSAYKFSAIDGEHEAEIQLDGTVNLKMKNVDGIKKHEKDFVLDTGSPHYVMFTNEVDKIDVVHTGRAIRNSAKFIKEGINVNFVQRKSGSNEIFVRTYERGVEDETLSCGTGVTASALVCHHNDTGFNSVKVNTKGGTLVVEYNRTADDSYNNIYLCGPAEKVFEGAIELAN